MLRRLSTRCLIRPSDVAPSRSGFEVIGVLNPGVAQLDGETVLLARVAERPVERRPGCVASPRLNPDGSIAVDWFRDANVEVWDARVFRVKETGNVRLSFISHIRVFREDTAGGFIEQGQGIFPDTGFETYGVEDPRVTLIDSVYYITYVAVSPHGACTALASTRDFHRFERHGVIFPCENKDVTLFPDRIGGRYATLHRPNPQYHFSPPEMWIAFSNDLRHWGSHQVLHSGSAAWESGRVGAGVPPIRTDGGWLIVYHGNQRAAPMSGTVGRYAAGALMLDLEDPARVIGATPEPILVPEADFERGGFLADVVFPTGAIRLDGVVRIFYGAADESIGIVDVDWQELLGAIKGF